MTDSDFIFRGYPVNIVFCIDGTRLMKDHISNVKKWLKTFREYILEFTKSCGTPLEFVRIRTIVFRDFKYSRRPLEDSEFIDIVLNPEKFDSFVDTIEVEEVGVSTSNALEAFAMAIKSDWHFGGSRTRQSIIIISNSGVLPLGLRSDCPNYPDGMPKDFDELREWWNDTVGGGKLLRNYGSTLFIPVFNDPKYPWNQMINWRWSNSFTIDFESILEMGNIVEGIIEID